MNRAIRDRRSARARFRAALVCGGLGLAQDTPAPDPAMDAIERQLETGRHAPLLAGSAESRLEAFSTGGCSGGLSAGWEQIAARFTNLEVNPGPEPPWQACCVSHDRVYHSGGAASASPAQSFERRKAADLELKD